GVGTVTAVRSGSDAHLAEIRAPTEVAEAVIPLGAIAVEGVSLTVNAVGEEGIIQVSLVPFNLAHTTLGTLAAGHRVHLEGDVIGKYVRHFLEKGIASRE